MENSNYVISTVERHFRDNQGQFSKGFKDWLLGNWSIYLEFERQAMMIRNSGRNHYSARTIVEYIRHQTLLADSNSGFKINNNCVADLARLFAIRWPSHSNLFEYRTSNKHPRPVKGGLK